MIALGGALFLVVCFLGLLKLFRLIGHSRRVIEISQESFATIRDIDLAEEEKERIMQRNAVRLFGLFFVLLAGGVAALLIPVGILFVAESIGLLKLQPIIDTSMSPAFLIGTTIAGCGAYFLMSKKKEPAESASASTNAYSGTDRLLHEVAFSTYPMQVSLSSLEDRLFQKALRTHRVERPVFIAALPRAGTTLLLECCAALPDFATHRYRDMPFVPIPCLWGSFARFFAKSSETRERAHGDGMMINADSPEALEEVIWMQFWAEQYAKDRIQPWSQTADRSGFREFFDRHMRKVIHRRGGNASTRYLSKNNLNIARLPWLRDQFPDAVLLVPFRDPVQHAASLLRQHRNFLSIHAEDAFAASYMRAIGHFDFGVNLRPVDFGGWLDRRRVTDPKSLAFWLEYWTAAYRYFLNLDCGLRFFSYDVFCESGEEGLSSLAEVVECREKEALTTQRDRVRSPRPAEIDVADVSPEILEEARQCHRDLLNRALNVSPAGCSRS